METKQDPRTGAVTVEIGGGLSVEVFPIGLGMLRRFDQTIGKLVASVGSRVTIGKGATADQHAAQLAAGIKAVFPVLALECLGMVAECCKAPEGVDLEALPHWEFARLADAWLEVNFDAPEKIAPWVKVGQTIAGLVTKTTQGEGSTT